MREEGNGAAGSLRGAGAGSGGRAAYLYYFIPSGKKPSGAEEQGVRFPQRQELGGLRCPQFYCTDLTPLIKNK